MSTKLKILFFASNPKDVNLLNLDEEIHSITQKIQSAEYRDVLDLISIWAVRPDDLLQELDIHKPNIVHFSGHGSKVGELVLMDDLHQAKTVSAVALEALFSTLKDNIRLVVLNACYSKTQATAIAEVIDCVIGMNTAIGDQAAITFAGSFYRAIGFGRSIKEAFDQGKVSLMLEGIPEEDTPQLLVHKGVNPASIYLIKPDPDINRSSRTPPKGKVTLVGSKQWYLVQPRIAVFIDQKEAISLKLTDQVTIEVEPGIHNIYVKLLSRSSNTASFGLQPGQTQTFSLHASRLWGGLKIEALAW